MHLPSARRPLNTGKGKAAAPIEEDILLVHPPRAAYPAFARLPAPQNENDGMPWRVAHTSLPLYNALGHKPAGGIMISAALVHLHACARNFTRHVHTYTPPRYCAQHGGSMGKGGCHSRVSRASMLVGTSGYTYVVPF